MYRYIELEYSAKIILKKKHTEHKQHIRAPTMPIQHYLLTFFIFNFTLPEFVWSMCSNGGKNVAHKWFFPCRISVSHFHFLTKYTNIGKFVIFSPCFASCWCCCCCVFRCPFHFYLVLLHGKTHFGWLASEHYHFVCPPIFRKSSLSFTVNKMRLEQRVHLNENINCRN